MSRDGYDQDAEKRYHAIADANGDPINRAGALRCRFLLEAREIQQMIVRRALLII
jgi:hypothetical protein